LKQTNRPSPNFALIGAKHETRKEIAWLTGGLGLLEGDEND
jgi:hypothetical protein